MGATSYPSFIYTQTKGGDAMQFPEHVHELKPEHYEIAGVPTYSHTDWNGYAQIPPKGALCCTIGRINAGECEFFVGDGIHKYADLAKVGGSIGTPSATAKESAIVQADETGKLTGWAAAILAAAGEEIAVSPWTPALAGSTAAGVFVYGANNAGQIIKFGLMAFVQATIHITEVTSAPEGTAFISGLADAAEGVHPVAVFGKEGCTGDKIKNIAGGLINGAVIELHGKDGSNISAPITFTAEPGTLYEVALPVGVDDLIIYVSGIYFIAEVE